MDLQLTQLSCDETGWFGSVQTLDGVHQVFVANHAYQQPDTRWAMKTPPGTYTCQLDPQAQLAHGGPFAAYEVTGVPGHWGILFHVGNYPQVDSEGCFLVGTGIGQINGVPAVLDSNAAFAKFMALQNGAQTFQLTVLAPQPATR
jgi:hypothetical protein